MPTFLRSPLLVIVSAVLSFSLAGCIFDQANRGTIVDNEVRVGILYLAGGKPAADARVRVYPVDFQPDTSAASGDPAYATRTDAQGRYKVKVAKGEFNILGDKDGAYAFQDSVYFGGGPDSLPPDTLYKPGSLAGVVGLQPDHNPISCLVQVLGTHAYANVDAEGRFRLANLAEGRYTLRVFTTYPEYTALITHIQVVSGRDDTLPDTLRLPFTGIPVVTGLRAVYDTAAAVVKLSWDPVKYRDFSEYRVYRDRRGVLVPAALPVGVSDSAIFSDSLLKREDVYSSTADTSTAQLEYRVRVRSKGDKDGPIYGKLLLAAPGPGRLRVQDSLAARSVSWDFPRQADRVTVAAFLKSPKRGIKSIRWSAGPADSVLATHELGGVLQALDSVVFHWAAEGAFTVRARVEDAAGTVVLDSLTLPGNSAPFKRNDYRSEYAFPADQSGSFDFSAADPDGDTMWYYLKNNPPWLRIFGNGLLHSEATNAEVGRYPGVVVVATDGRRSVESPPFTAIVTGVPWNHLPVPPTASWMSKAVTMGSRIFLLGGDMGDLKRVLIYDHGKKTWSDGVPLPAPLKDFTAQAVGSSLYVMGGAAFGADTSYNLAVYAFDTLTQKWSAKKPKPTGTIKPASAVVNGKIMVMAGQVLGLPVGRRTEIEEYDPAADAWTRKKPVPESVQGVPTPLTRGSTAVHNGLIYTVGWDIHPEPISSALLFAYDPVAETWTRKASMPAPRSQLAAGVIDGKIYAAGGYENGSGRATVEVYDIAADAWSAKRNMPQALSMSASAVLGNSLFLFQGQDSQGPAEAAFSYTPAVDP